MHQLSHDADIDLLMLITEQQREVKRLTERVEESSAAAREAKRDLKEAEKRLKALLEETIADRPLFKPREPEVAPVAAAPSWTTAEVHTLELEDDTVTALHQVGVRTVPELIKAAVNDLPGLDRDQAVDVDGALRLFRRRLDARSAEEFDAAVADARAEAGPPSTLDPEPERCPDCGGFLHLPTPRRKPRAKKACHLVRADGKARAMRVPPEEVRAKRENPPEIQPLIEPAAPTLEEILEAESEADADWYSLPVAKLRLPASVLNNLIEAQLIAVGDVAGLLADDGFRALTNEPGLSFIDAAKVRAAMDLCWQEVGSGEPPWAATGPDDCPADRERNAALIDRLKRELAGDVEPRWDRWSEFEVTLENGATVRVIYDPPLSPNGSGHFDFHGPLTETGYLSHFMLSGTPEKAGTPIVKFAEDFAREVARETAKDQAKEERRRKKAAKLKPVDDDAPAKAAKRKPETQRAVRRVYEQGDWAAQERIEALPPDPAEVVSE